MSISRLMLRALACVALQAQPDDASPPTMAEHRVFDSRLDPLPFEDADHPLPAIIVYTDDDDAEIINRSGGGPYHRSVDLRVEIVIGSFDTTAGNDELTFVLPMTDAQLEAQLDLFEQQVRWALLSTPSRAYSNAFAAFVVRTERIASHAIRDETGNNRFASRIMHFKCVINDDCNPPIGVDDGRPRPAALERVCDRLDAFPAPWIRPLLHALCNAPSMRPVLEVLTGTRNPSTFVPLLKRIGISVDAIDPEADPDRLSAQGKTHGPDGRIEVQNLLRIP